MGGNAGAVSAGMAGRPVARNKGSRGGRAKRGALARIGGFYSNDLSPMKKYMCLICGWIYDEAAGAPDEGIPPGTKWEDVPPNWTCPECGARKEDFELAEF